MKNITNSNYKGQCHGYQEWHRGNYTIWLRGNFKNDELIGYQEWHIGPRTTNFYIR